MNGGRNGKRAVVLSALAAGPMSNAALQDVLDDCGAYVARTMNALIKRGDVVNLRPGKHYALYALASTGDE